MSQLTKQVLIDEQIKGHKQATLLEPPKIEKAPLITNKDGEPKKVRANLTKILTYYDENLTELFAYNEATHNIEIIEDRKLGIHHLKAGRYEDITTNQIASYISNRYLLDFTPAEVVNEVQTVAVMKAYHPIKDFLRDSLANRTDRDPFEIVRKYLNIEDKPYNRLVLDLFFRGAIARVLTPGIQFDFCLDLIGPQGARKTSFLRQIFMNWYTDQISTFNQKDDISIMVQSWAVNDDELEATKKMTFGGLKKAITVTQVTFRPPYARSTLTLPVDFVFSRTTNERRHLGDATGDRRFIGVEVKKPTKEHLKTISPEDLRDFWGNYYASYLNNDRLYFDDYDEEMALIEEEREKFKKVDDLTELLNWYLSQKIPEDFYQPKTESYQRRGYYYNLLNNGVAYKTNYDKEQGREWQGSKVRDRISISDLMNELDLENKSEIKSKIRRFFDNLNDWDYKKRIKFGKRETSGYAKK